MSSTKSSPYSPNTNVDSAAVSEPGDAGIGRWRAQEVKLEALARDFPTEAITRGEWIIAHEVGEQRIDALTRTAWRDERSDMLNTPLATSTECGPFGARCSIDWRRAALAMPSITSA